MTLFFCILIDWKNSALTNHTNTLKMPPFFLLLSKVGARTRPQYMFLISFPGGEESAIKAATAGERPNVREEKREREQWSCSQAHVGDEVWGLAISEATPPLCPPNEYCHPLTKSPRPPPRPPPNTGTRATAQIMPCCQAWEEAEGGARFIISSRWQAAGRRKIGSYLVSSDICVWLCNSDLDSAGGSSFPPCSWQIS